MARTDPQFNLRIPAALKDRIAAAAKKNGRSVNAEILQLLEDHYPEPVTVEDAIADVREMADLLRKSSAKSTLRDLADELDALMNKIAYTDMVDEPSKDTIHRANEDRAERKFRRVFGRHVQED